MDKMYYIEIFNRNSFNKSNEFGLLFIDPLFVVFKSTRYDDLEIFEDMEHFKRSVVYSPQDFNKYVYMLELK